MNQPDPILDREPGVAQPRAQLAWQFRQQAHVCGLMASPLYHRLLTDLSADILADGPTWPIVREHVAPGRGNAIALRLMAAVHRLVLSGHVPALAARFPSVGGEADDDTWPTLRTTLERFQAELQDLVALPCQTNEPGRAAALSIGLLEIARVTGPDLALREIGTAAGLNLRWDHFHYEGAGQRWGDPSSPVDLSGFWVDPPQVDHVRASVVERRGVDRAPIDPTTDEGHRSLMSAVWADQVSRFARLRGAIGLAGSVAADIETGDAVDWVEDTFAPVAGQTTVLLQSVVREYLSAEGSERLEAAVHRAGRQASAAAPVAWLRLEPISTLRRHGLSLIVWPGGHEQALTTSGSLGADVRRPDEPFRMQEHGVRA